MAEVAKLPESKPPAGPISKPPKSTTTTTTTRTKKPPSM